MTLTQHSAGKAWKLYWSNGNAYNYNKSHASNDVRAVSEYLIRMEERNYTIPLEDIFEAYYDCRKNKRRTANALLFESDYETYCVELWREINEMTYTIGRSKEKILDGIADMAEFLKNELEVTLHPKKMYLQHYSKGVKFIGAVVKPYRNYIGNRTVGNMTKAISQYNKVADDSEHVLPHVESFLRSINSYLGFMIHYKSYNVRAEAMRQISPKWWKTCSYTAGINKVVSNVKQCANLS